MFKKRIFDVSTGEETFEDLTGEELLEAQKNWDFAQKQMEAEAKAKEKKAAEKTALLTKLGITAEEAKLLLS
jgi:hypothetical protein